MKRPTMLAKALLEQFGRDLGLSVERDVATLQRRCEHEGLSFLTITLPVLSDALERGLEDGLLTVPTDFCRTGRLPRFMGGFFSRVFARTGEVLPECDVEAIFAIRQVCRFFKKLKMPCTDSREREAEAHYLEIEEELSAITPSIGRKDEILDRVSGIIWSQVFPEVDPLDIVCKHGPGTTADKMAFNERHQIRFWYDRFELTYPSDLHAFPNYGYASESTGTPSSSSELNFLSVADEPPCRVVFVPKTQKSPRVIATEPHAMQYVQQGLMGYIVPRVEAHRLTRNSIRFTDQGPNQMLARHGSRDRSLATLDLKDASDRVHVALVRRIFRFSGIFDYLEDARSLHAVLPSGRNVILNKFASQGSAICFPTEAMVFYTLIQACMHAQDGVSPTSSSIRRYSDVIDVYGDDIIVPVNYAETVACYLESYGLKVNLNKSFRHSLFRESCGGDYYNGYSVKPVYARQLPPESTRLWTPKIVMAWVSTANQLYQLGLWQIAQTVRSMVEKAVRSRIPRSTSKTGAGLFFDSVCFTTDLRFNPDLCGYEQRRIVYQPTLKKDDIDGNAIASLNRWGISNRYGQDRNGPNRLRGLRSSSHLGQLYDLHPYRGEFPQSESESDYSRKDLRPVCGIPLFVDEALCSSFEEYVQPQTEDVAQASVRRLWETDLVAPQARTAYVDHLAQHNRSQALDFLKTVETKSEIRFSSSVKRGGFKSKHRWVTLIT